MKKFMLIESEIDVRIKTLHNQITEIEHEISNLERIKSIAPLLWQLKHHHASQAKPHSTPCSKEYNASLAANISEILGVSE